MSKETIWNVMGRYGFSDKAKAAIMGNAEQESGNETNRVQGDYSANRALSREYTAKVDSGEISRDDFLYRGPNGGGYGWLQWTFWSRKAGLYDLAKGRGVSIADETLALDWMWHELNTSEFSGVLAVLRSDASLREMTECFMTRFEKPDDKSQGAKNVRVRYAEEILAEFAGKEEPKEDTFWPPRGARGGKNDPGLCENMNGPDVEAMQSLLKAHGYTLSGTGGVFGASSAAALRKFQQDRGLAVDGICGPMTWAELLKL